MDNMKKNSLITVKDARVLDELFDTLNEEQIGAMVNWMAENYLDGMDEGVRLFKKGQRKGFIFGSLVSLGIIVGVGVYISKKKQKEAEELQEQ